jgi:predicted ATP-dependent protease
LCIEEGSRWVADQGRLSTVLSDLRDLAVEAASVAKVATAPHAISGGSESEAPVTTRAHVALAIAARERRMNLAADRIDQMIREGTILIDTSGDVVGQINGLTVLVSGNYAFGMPARITARTAPGLAGITNIERETMMSGPAHSKGILVLGGYLAGRYAHDQPLSLSATICLEQVYGEIEGDSASSAELYALLSSLAGLPIKQSLAVTGSVNQHGVVQAIGGVNEKIEGFYTLCAHQGLTGEQGVIIPRANVRNLMLRQEVIDAVRAGTFHIYAVSTIDEGIEILTGMPAGVADAEGIFSSTSVNGRVSQTLHEFARSMREFGPSPTSGNRYTARSNAHDHVSSRG